MSKHDVIINELYSKLLNSYLDPTGVSLYQDQDNEEAPEPIIDPLIDSKVISDFLAKGCGCARNCSVQFLLEEILETRRCFRVMPTFQKNCYILAQLRLFLKHSDYSVSSRSTSERQRQKFEYRINIDRPVCRAMFLFYHGETIKRLKRLQEYVVEKPITPPAHGNTGVIPINAYAAPDKETVISFIMNLAENHGLPDPGRDVRKGKGRLRILLPSIMNYRSIHGLYEHNIAALGRSAIGYRTFLDIWQKELPYIEFNKPRSDLCMTCENFKKAINQATACLDEQKEATQVTLYKEALHHLHHAKKERLYYKAHSKVASAAYKQIQDELKADTVSWKANSRDMMMSYSWDFAQQFQYPFEDQQVGPIYFKTPRRAQLFGVCCEGSSRQINYLIDEADFLEKNANTVISLLDHFFTHHGLGEMSAYLTADNCVGQNKNNALIQYLMYRVLSKLHTKIEMSFLIVGHTKFSPDSHFGLIRQRYRQASVYTYDQLAKIIEESAIDGYNVCQRYVENTSKSNIIYRDWTSWLSNYFKVIPNITSYHHFKMDAVDKGVIIVKKDIDSKEEKINLLKKETLFNENQHHEMPVQLHPKGLSLEREWYLYEQIRGHIPLIHDKDQTCPKPLQQKQKK